ncbi:MAG TPA: hypothetical protein VH227_05160 [Candidatus Udaeobacter sp.]|jgi:hypothetical protein|nr:hypothetical protein [Candidatus Udaeobacter sp.]
MNGAEPRIEIFKPFGEAFELTKKILFQPFDLKKWFVIGFTAWLANLGFGGGGGFNYQPNRRENIEKLSDTFGQIPHSILVTGICVLIALALVLVVLVAWLRARGRFMFIDCIVKNRGAVAAPWREFRTEGNSYFLFSLAAALCFLIFAALLSAPLIFLAIRGRYYLSLHRDRLEPYVLLVVAAWIFTLVFVAFIWALISNFMIPIMYRRRCRAYDAFRSATSLITAHPGEIVLYCIFLIVLAVTSVIVACFATCVTCCIAAIPYIGTVILLPVFVLFRSFSLLFLRQFGPDYDVWASFVPLESSPLLSSTPPVLPPSLSESNLPPQPPPVP